MGAFQERILVCGLQSSGATLVALLLAQDPSAIGILDLFCGERMPSPEYLPRDRPLILKMTMSTTWPMEEQIARFAPTRTLLVVRHPAHNYVSLDSKYYRDSGGRLEDKFVQLEEVFHGRDRFSALIHYEDLAMRPAIAIDQLRLLQPELDDGSLDLARTRAMIIEDARRYPWLETTFGRAWAEGNVDESARLNPHHVFKEVTREARDVVESLCPDTTRYYDEFYSTNYPSWRVHLRPWVDRQVFVPARRHAKQSTRRLRRAAHRIKGVLL